MGTCKTCRKWDKHTHVCNGADWLECRYDADMSGASFGVFANAHDDSGLHAALKTGPDFGCTNFQERTK